MAENFFEFHEKAEQRVHEISRIHKDPQNWWNFQQTVLLYFDI